MCLAVIFLRFYLMAQNKKKDRMLQEAGVNPAMADNLDHAFEDRTDRENLHFRYIY